MSHARRISYISEPMYYYLQRSNAITSQNTNKKNLDILQAWERCIKQTNAKYQWEIIYAIYCSIIKFTEYRNEYSTEYLNFLSDYMYLFEKNELVCINMQLQQLNEQLLHMEEQLNYITAENKRLLHIEERLNYSITENIVLSHKLDDIINSTSWRFTKPYRLIMDKLRGY
jgi:hypothetical protein